MRVSEPAADSSEPRQFTKCQALVEWPGFRDDPYEYLITCSDADADRIWTALRKREK